jgi:two-component system, NarL family, response regulator NreC
MPQNHQIIIADDNPFLRKGLHSILEHNPEFQIIGEAGNGLELMDLLRQGVVPDVLILDISMPIITGIEALRQLRQMGFVFKVLIVTMHKEADLLCQSFKAGANGYMLKDGMAVEIWSALHTLNENKVYLSPSMAKEMPDICQLKTDAEQGISASLTTHCARNSADALQNT